MHELVTPICKDFNWLDCQPAAVSPHSVAVAGGVDAPGSTSRSNQYRRHRSISCISCRPRASISETTNCASGWHVGPYRCARHSTAPHPHLCHHGNHVWSDQARASLRSRNVQLRRRAYLEFRDLSTHALPALCRACCPKQQRCHWRNLQSGFRGRCALPATNCVQFRHHGDIHRGRSGSG